MGAHPRVMTSPSFSELVSRLIEAMGQQLSAVRRIPEGLLLKTGDGFLYAFLEDPTQVSLNTVQKLIGEVGDAPMKLAILTPGHFPLALTQEVTSRRGSVVDSVRFAELVRSLGLGSYLGEEPPAEPTPTHARLLPSAQQLDVIVHRARTWLDWGVPALALRFYRQASTLKPEFLPARVGIGRALLGLGLVDDADRTFRAILATNPDDLGARLGEAAVLGARGRTDEEVRLYRKLLEDEPTHIEIRANLVAALIAEGHWKDARHEIEKMLSSSPEDPQIRFLHAAALWKTGESAEGDQERERARHLGLPFDRERALCEHLGLPAPKPPATPEVAAAPTPAVPAPGTKAAAAPPTRIARPSRRRAPLAKRPVAKTRTGRKAK